MAESVSSSPTSPAVIPSEGVTKAERYLAKLCKRSFLSLWSYPGIYRDQGWPRKEVCDLLVVFENHIIIFSDKDCRFSDATDLQLAWSRWFKKAVQKSAKQVWGAERWIKQFPNRLFLDRQCSIPFPINLPDPAKATFHRIVVAHDASRACQQRLGGSGSLMINSALVGDAHFGFLPFTIGILDPNQGYVHVFDDTALNIVMSTLDTITDFTAYLTRKEQFLRGNRLIQAAGEEELLAVYLRDLNAAGEHDFVVNGDYDVLTFGEGLWDAFQRNPQRQAQIEADRISYSWDALIEKFAFHAMTGTQYFTSGRPLRDQEEVFRFLARERRTQRRILATSMHEVLERTLHSDSPLQARVMQPTELNSPHYVFLFLHRKPGLSDQEYRNIRVRILSEYCLVTKLKFPEAIHIVGIASEAGLPPQRSEDFVYMNASRWTAKDEAKAKQIQERFGFLRRVKREATREYEYPIDDKGKRRGMPSRNSPCHCGSQKRFKNCHGKEFYRPKRGRKR